MHSCNTTGSSDVLFLVVCNTSAIQNAQLWAPTGTSLQSMLQKLFQWRKETADEHTMHRRRNVEDVPPSSLLGLDWFLDEIHPTGYNLKHFVAGTCEWKHESVQMTACCHCNRLPCNVTGLIPTEGPVVAIISRNLNLPSHELSSKP